MTGEYRDLDDLSFVVTGLGIAGFHGARALSERGIQVTVIDRADDDEHRKKAAELEELGARVLLGEREDIPCADVLVVSTGIPLSSPWIASARAQNMQVWGEFELAWRLRTPDSGPWLYVTGTNGKTTTTIMLEAMLRAAGLRTSAVGNIGVSLIEAVTTNHPYDVLAVEIGAPHLPFVSTVAPLGSVCLNIAPDHVDYFGSYEAYVAAKTTAYNRTTRAALANRDDPATLDMLASAQLGADCRVVTFGLDAPQPGHLGIEDGYLVDSAFTDTGDVSETPTRLARVADVQPHADHQVSNALAAAALARCYGVPAHAIAEGLAHFQPVAHRITPVATVAGVEYIDDSKATNWHAAATSLRAFSSIVWIAGGQAKGQDFGTLIRECAPRIKCAILLGVDRAEIADALARHAPEIPVIDIATRDTRAMTEAVRSAAEHAEPGDTVLLAPGCASRDMYVDYAARGDDFAAAVVDLGDANVLTP